MTEQNKPDPNVDNLDMSELEMRLRAAELAEDEQQAAKDAAADMANDPHQSSAEDMSAIADGDEISLDGLGENYAGDESAVIADLNEQLNTAKEQTMRALAEAENARKRAQKDRQDAGKFAVSGFARDLLDVADNLRRAMDAVPKENYEDDPQIKNLLIGIEGTEKILLKTFEKNKIQRLDPMGEIFDPNFHEVMFETPMPDQPAGTVIQVMEVGYLLHDRLLRPARVGVAKAMDGDSDNAPDSPTPGDTVDQEI